MLAFPGNKLFGCRCSKGSESFGCYWICNRERRVCGNLSGFWKAHHRSNWRFLMYLQILLAWRNRRWHWEHFKGLWLRSEACLWTFEVTFISPIQNMNIEVIQRSEARHFCRASLLSVQTWRCICWLPILCTSVLSWHRGQRIRRPTAQNQRRSSAEGLLCRLCALY